MSPKSQGCNVKPLVVQYSWMKKLNSDFLTVFRNCQKMFHLFFLKRFIRNKDISVVYSNLRNKVTDFGHLISCHKQEQD